MGALTSSSQRSSWEFSWGLDDVYHEPACEGSRITWRVDIVAVYRQRFVKMRGNVESGVPCMEWALGGVT